MLKPSSFLSLVTESRLTLYLKERPSYFLANNWTMVATAESIVTKLCHMGKRDLLSSRALSNAFLVLLEPDHDTDDMSYSDNWASQDYQDLVVLVMELVLLTDDNGFSVDLLLSLDLSAPEFVPSTPLTQVTTGVVDATSCSFENRFAEASTLATTADACNLNVPSGNPSVHYLPLLPSLDQNNDGLSISSVHTDLSDADKAAVASDVATKVAAVDASDTSSAFCSIRKAFLGQLVQLKNLEDVGFNGELGRLVSYRKHKKCWGVLLMGCSSKDGNPDLDKIITCNQRICIYFLRTCNCPQVQKVTLLPRC